MGTTSGASTTDRRSPLVSRRLSCSWRSSAGPTSDKATPRERAACTAPSMTAAGAWSPPMASTATVSTCSSANATPGQGSGQNPFSLPGQDAPAGRGSTRSYGRRRAAAWPRGTGGIRSCPPASEHRACGASRCGSSSDVVLDSAWFWFALSGGRRPRRETNQLSVFGPRSRRSASIRGSTQPVSHEQVATFRFVPHTGHNPWQSGRQSGFIGSAR